MNRHIVSLAAMLLGINVADAAQTIRFAGGRAAVPLPDAFKVTTNADGLEARFGAKGDHLLQLTLLQVIEGRDGMTDKASMFVKIQAEKKGARLQRSGDRAAFMETGAQEKRGATTFQAAHWQIGIGNCLFTMTLTAPLPMSSDLDAFLGEPLNAIVNEMSCAAP